MFCLGDKNPFRKFCVWLIEWKWFDRLLTLCILINALNIAGSDYSWRNNDPPVEPTGNFSYWLGMIITIIFILEFFFKLFGMGFVFDKNCYLRDAWNCLDFVVVVTGMYGFIGDSNFSALRTIRLLRPLRSINKIRGIRVIVEALL